MFRWLQVVYKLGSIRSLCFHKPQKWPENDSTQLKVVQLVVERGDTVLGQTTSAVAHLGNIHGTSECATAFASEYIK